MRTGLKYLRIVLTLLLFISQLPANRAYATNGFQIKTGYYIGTGVSGYSISGLGFEPDFVMIKSASNTGIGVFKTSAMPIDEIAFFSATAHNTTSQITLDTDGFTVGNIANVNSVNILYFWTAIGGSDCTVNGYFCVGRYTGNGVNPRNIGTGTIDFLADATWIKRTTNVAANFRVASMPTNHGLYFTNTAINTTGALFDTMAIAEGFAIGTTNNTNGGIFDFVSFRQHPLGGFTQGSYDPSTPGVGVNGFQVDTGFLPANVIVKNATSNTAGNRNPLFSITQNYGNQSNYIGVANASITNAVTSLNNNGFTLGTSNLVNNSSDTFYWMAFERSTSPPNTNGSFDMASGTYTGNGTSQSITGLSFAPDLVIIKNTTSNTHMVFSTKMMPNNTTFQFANATGSVTGGITSLNSDGFSVGNNALVNTNGNVYSWIAFGNAYNPITHSGSAEFMIGAYVGNGITDRQIDGLPNTLNMLTVKRVGNSAGAWKTSENSINQAMYFGANAFVNNVLLELGADFFEFSANNIVNRNADLYYWFGFADSDKMSVGTYIGNVTNNRVINSIGVNPGYIWLQGNTATDMVVKSEYINNTLSYPIRNVAPINNAITTLSYNSFVIGTSTAANGNGIQYIYVAWEKLQSILSVNILDNSDNVINNPSLIFNSTSINFQCTQTNATFGTASQKTRVTNTTSNPSWNLSIAATNGNTSLWDNGNSEFYDYNDSNVCTDGSDSDLYGGRLQVNSDFVFVTPSSGCTTTGLNIGTNTAFDEGNTDSITLIFADSSANNNCHWDITGIQLIQNIPANQATGTYSLPMTITIIAL
jgi:hypothetical protein